MSMKAEIELTRGEVIRLRDSSTDSRFIQELDYWLDAMVGPDEFLLYRSNSRTYWKMSTGFPIGGGHGTVLFNTLQDVLNEVNPGTQKRILKEIL